MSTYVETAKQLVHDGGAAVVILTREQIGAIDRVDGRALSGLITTALAYHDLVRDVRALCDQYDEGRNPRDDTTEITDDPAPCSQEAGS